MNAEDFFEAWRSLPEEKYPFIVKRGGAIRADVVRDGRKIQFDPLTAVKDHVLGGPIIPCTFAVQAAEELGLGKFIGRVMEIACDSDAPQQENIRAIRRQLLRARKLTEIC